MMRTTRHANGQEFFRSRLEAAILLAIAIQMGWVDPAAALVNPPERA